jgi:exopolyphosphatase
MQKEPAMNGQSSWGTRPAVGISPYRTFVAQHVFLDLDSLASSIAYSYIESTTNNKLTVALLPLGREDLAIRPENLYALELAGISDPAKNLLFASDLSEYHPFPSRRFALVDHNRIGPVFIKNNPEAKVVLSLDRR